MDSILRVLMPFFGPKNYSEMLWKIALADFWLTLACTFLVRQDPWVDGLFSRLEHLPGFKEFATAVKAPDVNLGGFAIALAMLICQSAPKFDPVSASNFDPFERRVLTEALASSELAGVAETWRARAM
jgi:hypothetical protein